MTSNRKTCCASITANGPSRSTAAPTESFLPPTVYARIKNVHLAGGFVMDNLIECPKHNGRFDYTTGQAKGAPVWRELENVSDQG